MKLARHALDAGRPRAVIAVDDAARALAREEYGLDLAHFERALLGDARQFLQRPGKAFRARLIETSFLLAGGPAARLPRASLEAIELLHAGSLIVDDIQDEAETRRGAPALHRQIGVARALNVGNWLYFIALSKLDELDLPERRARELTRAAHLCLVRCHEGQALDLTVRIGDVKRSEVHAIARTTTELKTGALMGFAARLGATVAGAEEAKVQALVRFGERMGSALQMLDDLGSFVSSERQHKALEDLRGQRVSWVWAWASETLDEVSYRQLTQKAARAEQLDEVLQRLAGEVERVGRLRIQAALQRCLEELRATFGSTPVLEALVAELSRLEKSYG